MSLPGTSGQSVSAPGSLKTAVLSFTSTGVYSVDLAGTTAGSGYSQLTATGPINLAGATLSLLVGSGFNPSTGTVFDILVNSSGSAITGTFANLAQGATVTAPGGEQFSISYLGGSSGHDVVLTRLATTLTTIGSVVITDGIAADGTAQRSEVRQITVTFSGQEVFAGTGTINANAAAAIQLQHLDDGVNIANLQAAVSTNSSNQTVVTLTFTTTGNSTSEVDPVSITGNANAVPGPSLADGRYHLTINAADVSGPGGLALAGNGTTPGTNYISPTDTQGGGPGQLGLYRLFGDVTGNGIVDQLDLAQFRAANNSSLGNPAYLGYLDADNTGTIDQIDLAQFRQRNNSSVFPTTPGPTLLVVPASTPPSPGPAGLASITSPPTPPRPAVNSGITLGEDSQPPMVPAAVRSTTPFAVRGVSAPAATAIQSQQTTDINHVFHFASISTDDRVRPVTALMFFATDTDSLSVQSGGIGCLVDGGFISTNVSNWPIGTNSVKLGATSTNGTYLGPIDAQGGALSQPNLSRFVGGRSDGGIAIRTNLGPVRTSFANGPLSAGTSRRLTTITAGPWTRSTYANSGLGSTPSSGDPRLARALDGGSRASLLNVRIPRGAYCAQRASPCRNEAVGQTTPHLAS